MPTARPARLLHRILVVVLLVPALAVLAGCRIPTGEATAQAPQTSTAHDLAAVRVSGAAGDAEPVLTVPAPFAVESTVARVVSEGDGKAVAAGQQVVFRYTAVNGTDGKLLQEKTWSGEPTTIVLGSRSNIQGLDAGLRNLAVGSRALIAFPPDAGYGVQGNPALGVGPTDTIVCLVEVLDARTLLKKANGKPVAARTGLPTVKRAADGEPTISLPRRTPPTSLVVQPLLAGKGPEVGKGDTITVQYTGVVWPEGRVFDSSWSKDEPARFAVGTRKTISGWDGIIGQRVGSQVMLVVPPDRAFGVEGNDKFGIKGTDTLVFVVDILDTRKA